MGLITTVRSSLHNYDIEFFQALPEDKSNILLIIDQNVLNLYPSFNKFEKIIKINAVEKNKTLEYVSINILPQFSKLDVDKKTLIFAVGGGITQELASFTASIYLRGLDWHFVPTTLLSQVDSCIGGKNSLNSNDTKNVLGTFYPPKKVFIDFKFLETLPNIEKRSGFGELIKIHLLSGKNEFDKLFKPSDFENLILNSIRLKKNIVEKDEFDTGLRLKLNLGHTFGHALESATRYAFPHGVLVSYGIYIALKFSEDRGLYKGTSKTEEIIRLNLKEDISSKIDWEVFKNSILNDKKNTQGELSFILPVSDGEVELYKISKNEINNIVDFSRQILKNIESLSQDLQRDLPWVPNQAFL